MSDAAAQATMATKPSIATLQAGRGIAALAVVVHHAARAATDFKGGFAGERLLGLGYLGVDFFFVLSGFIIAHTCFGTQKAGSDYLSARLNRVFVPYLPIGVGMALVYLALPTLSAGGREWSWLATLTLLPVPGATALPVAWTLKHELLFYVIFGAAFFGRILVPVLATWAGAIVAGRFWGWGHGIPFAPINLEFFMGIGLAVAFRRGWNPAGFWIGAPLWLGLWIALGANPSQSLLVGLAIACALLPIVSRERERGLVVPTPLVLLGAISYSLYLVHTPLISLLARIVPLPGLAFVAVSSGAAVVAGMVYYRIVERKSGQVWSRLRTLMVFVRSLPVRFRAVEALR